MTHSRRYRVRPEGRIDSFYGRNGARDVLLHVSVPHGKTRRDIQVPLEPELIMKIAECLTCCPQHIGERVPVGTESDGITYRYEWRPFVNVGHAIWHYDNPDAVRPCLPRNREIIDVDANPTVLPGSIIDIKEGV